MRFTRLLNQVKVRTHWIISLLSALHEVRLGSYGFYTKLVTLLLYPNGLLPFKEEIAVLVESYLERDVKGIALLYHVDIANDMLVLPHYTAQAPRNTIRAFRDQILLSLGCKSTVLVDVRSPGEYSGELLAPGTTLQEGVQRGGHIPSAVNIPWAMAVREDGTFRSAEELRTLRLTMFENGLVSERLLAFCDSYGRWLEWLVTDA